ncbi:MAG: CHASE3 domain-containing protein [Christensenellales bacterium]
MRNLSVSKKLLVGFGIVLALMLLSTALSIISISSVAQQVDLCGQYTLPNTTSIWMIRRNIVSAQRYIARAFIEHDVHSVENLLANADEEGMQVLGELEQYAANQRDSETSAKIHQLRELLEQAGSIRLQIGKHCFEIPQTTTNKPRMPCSRRITYQPLIRRPMFSTS